MRFRHRCGQLVSAFLVLFFVFAPCVAQASCTNPTMAEGSVFYNAAQHVPQVCSGSTWVALGALNPAAGSGSCSNPSMPGGSIFYNDDFDVLQYCDGSNWKAVQAAPSGGCIAPASCPNIGDVCDDSNAGTTNDPIFAGFVTYNDSNSAEIGLCKALFVSNNNQSTSTKWKTSTGSNDIATDSYSDGKFNANQVANSSTFPAFKLCKDLGDGGYSDWYLPSVHELSVIWYNAPAIDANAAGNFAASNYWSSTEYSTSFSFRHYFGAGGGYGYNLKTDNYAVRCVRRD